MEVEVEQQSSDLETVKKTWLEPLRELVASVNEKFSSYFSQMKCAGQVRLKEHDTVRRQTVWCVHCQEAHTEYVCVGACVTALVRLCFISGLQSLWR